MKSTRVVRMRSTLFTPRFFWSLLFGYDFFISYRRDEASAYAEKLHRNLCEQGFVCFLDREQTVGGVELAPTIRSALKRSRALVVILTPNVVQSPWVKQEVEAFLGRRERLIPISVGGFLAQGRSLDSPFAMLRSRSWIDERETSISRGEPSDNIVAEVRKNYDRRRVRTLALFLGLALLVAAVVGGSYVGTGYIEDRRQRELAYAEVRKELGDTKTLLRYMVFAAQDFHSADLAFGRPPYPPFARFAETDVVALLQKFDLARRASPRAPFIGYQPIMEPGDRTPAVLAISAGARRIKDAAEIVRRDRLAVASPTLIRGITRFATHNALTDLAGANEKMRRYHEIDDSEKLRFVVVGNPGVLTKAEYLDFVSALQELSSLLRINPDH